MPDDRATDSMASAADNGQFLTFTLQNEEYGIEILKVQEIKGFSKITPIPNAPLFVRGVMNLRGTVVPIIDLRARFSMTEKEYDQFTCIIVVNVGTRVVGLVASRPLNLRSPMSICFGRCLAKPANWLAALLTESSK